jgi:hypothetical protein
MGETLPDIGNEYVRELERKQLDEAYQRQGRTRVPSMLWSKKRLGIDPRLFSNIRLSIGQKLLLLGPGFIMVLVLAFVAAWLTPPTPY